MSSRTDGPRLFDRAAVQKHVDAALAQITPNTRRVLLAFGKTDGSVTVAYAERLTQHWTLGAIVSHAPQEGWDGTVVVKGVW